MSVLARRYIVLETDQRKIHIELDDGGLAIGLDQACLEARCANSSVLRSANCQMSMKDVKTYLKKNQVDCETFPDDLYNYVSSGRYTEKSKVASQAPYVDQNKQLSMPEGLFTEESDAEARDRIRYELLVDRITELHGGEASEPLAFVLHDVLSKHECEVVRRVIDDELECESRVAAAATGNRECDRVVKSAPPIAKHCLARAMPILKKIVARFVVGKKEGEYKQSFPSSRGIEDQQLLVPEQKQPRVTLTGYDAERVFLSDEKSIWKGVWELDSMKEKVTCLRYNPGDHFDQHEDDNQEGPGHSLLGQQVKSLFTGLLYLNSDFRGGSTNIKSHTEGNPILLELNPGNVAAAGAPGCLLFFFQKGLLHEGHRVEAGNKYVMRSDLFYRQVERGLLETNEQRGLELLQEARDFFRAGNMHKCFEKFDEACKEDPAISKMSCV